MKVIVINRKRENGDIHSVSIAPEDLSYVEVKERADAFNADDNNPIMARLEPVSDKMFKTIKWLIEDRYAEIDTIDYLKKLDELKDEVYEVRGNLDSIESCITDVVNDIKKELEKRLNN